MANKILNPQMKENLILINVNNDVNSDKNEK
jgi:hypothetical protein